MLASGRSFEVIVTLGAATLCAVGVVTLQRSTLTALISQRSQVEYRQQEQTERNSVVFLQKLPAFGFNNLIADWSFLKFIQYFGDTPAREKTDYSLVPEYFEVIVRQDPRFLRAYLYLSTASSIFAGRPDRTVALMNQGLKSLSPQEIEGAYYIWLYKGVDELLFLGNNKAAQHSYETAADWARQQGNQEIAARAKETAQFLARNPDSKRAQASAWGLILSNAQDSYTRKLALTKIQALGGKVTYKTQGKALIMTVQMPQED